MLLNNAIEKHCMSFTRLYLLVKPVVLRTSTSHLFSAAYTNVIDTRVGLCGAMLSPPKLLYRNTMKTENKARKKSTSCGGLPYRTVDGKLQVLLIQQFAHKNSWGIPKGHQHEGETLEDCAKREIREEAGIMVTLEQRLPDVGTVFRNEDKTVVSWLCTVQGSNEPRHDDPDSEVADAKWFHIDALPTLHVYQRPLIAAAIDVLMGRTILLKVDAR